MEHTIKHTLEGSAVLELANTGEATACFAVRDSSVSDVSHYQAHDGKDHHYENDDDVILGSRGRWSRIEGTHEIELHLDRFAYRSCEVADDVSVSAEPIVMRCLGLSSTSAIPSAGLACRPDAVPDQRVVGPLSLVLGDQARSWGLRNDLALREPPVGDEVVAWLLLGMGQGLRVQGWDDRSGLTLLEVELAEVQTPRPLD
jgi:hypothetical protein